MRTDSNNFGSDTQSSLICDDNQGTAAVQGATSRRFRISRLIGVGLAIIATAVAACWNEQQVPTKPRLPISIKSTDRNVGARPSSIRSAEGTFAKLSAAAPSAAGFFFDAQHALVLQVRDSADFGPARTAAQLLLANSEIRGDRFFHGLIRIQQAKYTFYQLAAWRDTVLASIVAQFKSIRSLDVDEIANRVAIGVDPASLERVRAPLEAALTAYGVDSGAVVLIADQGSVLVSSMAPQLFGNSMDSTADTLVGGIFISTDSTGNPGILRTCTMSIVLDYGGTRSFMTGSHCTRVPFALDGDTASQTLKTYSRSRLVGIEAHDTTRFSCSHGTLICRNADAAIYTIMSSIYSQRGLIARPTYRSHTSAGSLTWDSSRPYFIVEGTNSNPAAGVEVEKVGSTTGWTYGSVGKTCQDRQLADGTWILCMTGADAYTDHGDSGSPFFVWDGLDEADYAGVLSLHSSDGYNYFSPLSQIAKDLPATMGIARTTSLSTPTISGSIDAGGHPVLSWSAISGATGYQVTGAVYDATCSYAGTSDGRVSSPQTTFGDASLNVTAVYTSQPICPYVQYEIYAFSSYDLSGYSNTVYFSTQ